MVVLAVNADKKTGTGPAYLSQPAVRRAQHRDRLGFWLMPARFGAKNDLFQYAWIDPEGRLDGDGARPPGLVWEAYSLQTIQQGPTEPGRA